MVRLTKCGEEQPVSCAGLSQRLPHVSLHCQSQSAATSAAPNKINDAMKLVRCILAAPAVLR